MATIHATDNPAETARNLKEGDKITIVFMNSMAMTSARRVLFSEWKDDYLIFREPRKRDRFKCTLKNDVLIFPGHPKPLTDTDTGNFWGNACINLVGDYDELRALISGGNMNPNFREYGKITYRAINQSAEELQMLFPDAAEEIQHSSAPVARILKGR